MARAGDSDIGEQIKTCFREFDKDGNGAITRRELQNVLQRLCRPGQTLTREEIDRCVDEADKNENGVIEYEEFVDWLMKPGSRVQASKEGAALFDFEAVLRPLFEVFDRNGNGIIHFEEFEECFLILQNSIRMGQTGNKKQPSLLEAEASEMFEQLASEDKGIDFEEFVNWQRKALEKSGLLSEDLKDLVPALARQLQRIFRLSEAQEKGELKEEDTTVITRIIDNISTFTSNIWNEGYDGHNSLHGRKHYTNRWSDPPVGLNVERLMRRHMHQSTLRVCDFDKHHLQVYCIPENVPENQEDFDLSARKWIARISQGYVVQPGEEPPKNAFNYYVYSDLVWKRDEASAASFKEAYENFSEDMLFYCLMKTQANFGVSMAWDMVQTALKNAVAFGLMTADAHKKYNESVESQVFLSLREEGILAGLNSEERRQKVQDTLNSIKVATRSVMAKLIELEIFRVSSKLADLMGS